MKKIFYCLIVLFIVLGSFTPVHAKKSDGKQEEGTQWYEEGLFEGLNNKKNESASMSYQEYAVVLSHLFGVDEKEVIKKTQEATNDPVNLRSAIKQGAAKNILTEFLPNQLEEPLDQWEHSDKPLKRKDLLQVVDGFVNAYYNEAGEFEGQDIKGNAWINASGVTISESTISGDLVVASGKDILLNEVTVNGTVYIDEGIQNEVSTVNSDLNRVLVYDADEKASDWSLVWNDEFLSDEIDSSKWSYDIGNWIVDENGEGVAAGWGNNEKEYYTDSSENSYTEDGQLVIKAKKEEEPISDEFGTYDYTSAKLKTKGLFSKKYGKFEAKMKLPEGQGFWPAFWMMPEDDVYGPWPTSGEIDIMEAAGKDTSKIGGTIHYGEEWPNNTYTGKEYHFPEGEDYTGYHTYSVEWEPGEIRWYVDGELYQTLNDWFSKGENQGDKYAYPAPFDQEFYMILNLAVGGWYGGDPDETTEFPGTMEVDYVRVYELTGREYKEPVEPVVEEETLPEDAKQPLEDGNFIYDQNYEKGINVVDSPEKTLDSTYWNFLKLPEFQGEGNLTIDELGGENFAKTEIINPGNALWSLQQIQKLPVLKGHTYKVSFDAKSNTTRNIMTKVSGGAERGYPNYSGEKTMGLTENLQSYEYTFKFNQDTDLAARLEFNMGSNGTAPVWIGNVRVEDITDQVGEDSSKPALGDGNLIYNGTFDQGDMTRLNYWELSSQNGADASVVVPESSRKAEITVAEEGQQPGNILFSQGGIPLAENQEYELKFDANASEARSLQVEVVNEDGSVQYFSEEAVSLTKEMTGYTLTFQLPEELSGEVGQLRFLLGGEDGDVTLDNIRMIQTSVIVAPINFQNGDFSQGMEPWGSYIHFDASADVDVVDEELKIAIENAGNETWSVLAEQPGLSLSKGAAYTLSFDAKSTLSRDIEVTLENTNYTRYLSETVSLNEDMEHYEFQFEMVKDDVTSLKFLMGQFADAHDIYIDNVKVEVK
ncbi:carbohydrate binding domain-containing protein [Halobacillus aidingensis]|uniref:Carbohydrate binding domain-containing protein n=1 Tax=Halobacillus aidingensis TaxID=240303 RepID=A0A1H0K2Z6_HALAD|nr:carbohydrate binding domain-containing protein [Halobacillus aidingensis]SDO50150.1 Carbohydrate binding domain-containing protein [Halobacillus aidingensis]